MQSQRVVVGVLWNHNGLSYIDIDWLEDKEASAAVLMGHNFAPFNGAVDDVAEG